MKGVAAVNKTTPRRQGSALLPLQPNGRLLCCAHPQTPAAPRTQRHRPVQPAGGHDQGHDHACEQSVGVSSGSGVRRKNEDLSQNDVLKKARLFYVEATRTINILFLVSAESC